MLVQTCTKYYNSTLYLNAHSLSSPDESYDFLGWGLSADATEPVYLPGAAFTTNADTNLYAVWRKSYAINIGYDNTNTGVACTNAQCMIDAINYRLTGTKSPYYNGMYFAYGNPTTSSTQDFTTLSQKIFVGLDATTSQKSVCVVRNGSLYCFKNNNVAYEQTHIQQVFSDISCVVDSSDVTCQGTDFTCAIYSNGRVGCSDNSNHSFINLYSDNSVIHN